jgi:hypothetical protein
VQVHLHADNVLRSVDELYALSLQRFGNRVFAGALKFVMTFFKFPHGTAADAGCVGEVFLGPCQKRACGPACGRNEPVFFAVTNFNHYG